MLGGQDVKFGGTGKVDDSTLVYLINVLNEYHNAAYHSSK